MATLDPAAGVDTHPHEYVTAKSFDQSGTFPRCGMLRDVATQFAFGQPRQDLPDNFSTLLDLANANPDACIHVPLSQRLHLEHELIVRCIADRPSGVEVASGGAADITTTRILAR